MDLSTDRAHLWHPYASAVHPPPVLDAASSDGACIVLDDGTRLIDGISSWWCAAYGHACPTVVRAIREQAAKLPHVMFAGLTVPPPLSGKSGISVSSYLPNRPSRFRYSSAI